MQPTNSADALSQLQQFQSSAKNPQDILAAQQQQLGVNAAQQNVSGLQGAIANTTKVLNNVAPSVMGRTGNSLVTSAQANNQIVNQQAPVSQQLNTQNTALGQAEQTYGTEESQAENAANLAYQGQQGQESYLQNIYNALYQKEQDAAAAAYQQQQLAEQKREADLSASSAANSLASPSFGFGGGQPPTAPTTTASDPIKQQATSAISSLLGTNNKTLIQNTVNAIKKSAGYGDTYDQLKLQLLQALAPQYLQPSGYAAPLPGLGQSTLKTQSGGVTAANSLLSAIGVK